MITTLPEVLESVGSPADTSACKDGATASKNVKEEDAVEVCEQCGCTHSQEDEEDEEDGFEDCEQCGYTHPYEDKCPNEATAYRYEKWRKDD